MITCGTNGFNYSFLKKIKVKIYVDSNGLLIVLLYGQRRDKIEK
ncbi:hypothetical protein J2W47_003647 [Priestia megaterium]|nr:hypothetical protein [Priestia megaterium]